ncbi:hypothetical protein JCM3774_001873 [Rhodotorula dairenensis]
MATPTSSRLRIKLEEGEAASANQFPSREPEIRYRSSNFFAETDAFESAADFFEQSRVQLLSDCGYEAKPSKNKPTKISVRCEEFATSSCPFRLCAFLDQAGRTARWRLSLNNSVWDHSHIPKPKSTPAAPVSAQASLSAQARSHGEASTSRAGPASAQSSNPPAAASRVAVLYDETARFPTIDAFFLRTRNLSLEKYDINCTPHHNTDDAAVASCLLRQVCRCPYRVRAKRIGAGFVVDFDRSNWEHNHVRGSREAVAPGIAMRDVRQPERSDGDSRNYDSAVEEAVPSAGEEARVPFAPSSSRSKLAVIPPAAPKVGDCFDNLGEGYVAFAIANITQLGVSVFRSGPIESLHGALYCNRRASTTGCPFKALFGPARDNGLRTAVLPSSVLYHAHETNPKLLADPSWRPTIRCKIVSAAFDKLDRQKKEGGTRASTSTDFAQPPEPKRARLSEPAASSSSLGRSVDWGGPRSSLPPHMRSLAGMAVYTQPRPAGSSDPSTLPQEPVEQATPVSNRSSTPPSALFTLAHSPITSVTAALPSPPGNQARRAETGVIASFLAGLDGALVPLAVHLVEIGIGSLDALVHLATLSAEPRQALLEQLQQSILRDPACPSPLRLAPFFPTARP